MRQWVQTERTTIVERNIKCQKMQKEELRRRPPLSEFLIEECIIQVF